MSGTGRRGGIHPLIAGFVAGVVIAFVVGLMATINLQYGAPWASTHTLTAQVADADSMSVGSDVRIAGRLVGQVTSITAAGTYSNITFHVDEGDWPLPADTTAFVRLATLLGQKYVQLNPGHSSQLLAEHATLGLSATKPVVDFDQILNTFDKQTTDSLTSLIRTVASGVQNQEGTIQQLIPNLSDLSIHSQVPLAELVTRDPEFNKILINLGTTAEQLNASRNDFAGVIDNLNSVTATLASKEGSALKSYITNTDSLNITTDAVLGGGTAATLDTALQKVSTFTAYLNNLLATLVPETALSSRIPPGYNQISDGNPTKRSATTPAQAGIDLIYEIGGSAVSQGDGNVTYRMSDGNNFTAGNFFLRQFAQGIDVCGLLPVCTAPVVALPQGGLPPPPVLPPLPITVPCIPNVTCTGPGGTPPLCIPTLTCPGDTPPTLPPLPTLPPTNGTNSTPPPIPTVPPLPTPCIPIVDPTCPTAPIGIGYQVTVNDQWHWTGFWPMRYR